MVRRIFCRMEGASILTLGSLFDGIGVFPLAATHNGITPLWASEIQKAPISITQRHFPQMEHLGDITQLHGGDIPPVHIITFGSPCQNFSQIGDRCGLAGEKSSLFYHAIRIIREMREATNHQFPIINVWENVMGAFSSSNGLDFNAALRMFQDAQVPMPTSGRWASSGMVRGRCPDLAWRLMDAQYWASPRLARRQRIFVVADFGGHRANEILFKPRPMFSLPPTGAPSWLPSTPTNRGAFVATGGRIPIVHPFQLYRMRGAAKDKYHVQFRGSFGRPDDPFPTLLATCVSPFSVWYEDAPTEGCIRFPTERECERLLGLPDDWTEYGIDGNAISSAQRYAALGNSIALPCADYIMAGISEALNP